MEGNKDDEPAKDEDEPQPEPVPAAPSKANISRILPLSQQASRTKPEGTRSAVVLNEEPPLDTRSNEAHVSEAHISESKKSSVREIPSERKYDVPPSKIKITSESPRSTQASEKVRSNIEEGDEVSVGDPTQKRKPNARSEIPIGLVGCLTAGLPSFDNFSCSKFFSKRSPFAHNPPQPEERRPRIDRPRCPRDYIINLREDLADFQESHGLPRTRDYSFMSLGLALAQETARAICSLFLMFSELFPVVAIISLVFRFALDKLIDILETNEPIPKLKKTLIFCLQMIMILIPLWILIGTIVLPLAGLLLSIFKKLLRFKGGKSARISCGPRKQGSSPSVKK